MTKERRRFEEWWDAEDDIPNDGPYTPDTPIQFAWAGWQAALAQPEQEPVQKPKFWYDEEEACLHDHFGDAPFGCIPLYTTPPAQRKPLTDEQVNLFINGRGDEHDEDYVEATGDGYGLTDADLVKLVRKVEAAHGIKENT
jgi:hypothetical protein